MFKALRLFCHGKKHALPQEPYQVAYLETMPPYATGSSVLMQRLQSAIEEEKALPLWLIGPKPPLKDGLFQKQCIYLHIAGYAALWDSNQRGARWQRYLYLPLWVLLAWQLLRKPPPQRLWAIFPSASGLLAGYILSWLLNCPLWLYMHNTFVENRQGFWRFLAVWLQKTVVARSQKNYLISQGMLEVVQSAKISANWHILPHMYSQKNYQALQQRRYQMVFKKRTSHPYPWLFAGNINASCEDALLLFLKALQGFSAKQRFLWTSTSQKVLKDAAYTDPLLHFQEQSPENICFELQQADVLLLPHGLQGHLSTAEYHSIFPTKTLDYLQVEVPIICLAPYKSYLWQFMQKYRCAYCLCHGDLQSIRHGLYQIQTDKILRRSLQRHAKKALRYFQANHWLEALGPDKPS